MKLKHRPIRHMKRILFFLFLLIGIFCSCRTSMISKQNLSYLYDKDMSPYIPDYTIYHINDSVSTIHYCINSSSLLYVKELNEDVFTAKFKINAELYESYEMKQLLDSADISIYDTDNIHKKDINGTLNIKAKIKGTYLLKIIFSDLNKNTTVESYLNIYRESPNSSQDFLLLGEDSLPIYHNWVASDEYFRIETSNKNQEIFFVRYYDRNFPVAAPPYSVSNDKPFDFNADSTFTVPVSKGSTAFLKLKEKGIYFFQSDTSSRDGMTVLRFDANFPKVTSVLQMLYPLRYLTSKSEYDDLILSKKKKEAVDKFWLTTAGNEDRAKEMIQLYYNRVKEANRFFTSYLEGWKTDMGIIYIIYGPPNVVSRGKDIENWVYGEDRNLLSITFSFVKVENPFTDNDYSLSRSPAYKDGWYIAVDNWRR